jgi:aminoglycoside 6'-N-acetyltransferase
LELTTARLRLRPLDSGDLPEFIAYRSDPDVARYQSWEAPYPAEEGEGLVREQRESRHFEPGQWLQVAILLGDDEVLCGDCGLCVLPDWHRTIEVGLTLAQPYQGQGIATEALRALATDLLGPRSYHRIVAHVDERNLRAQRLFERIGFRQEARLVAADWFKGSWATLLGYALLESDWPVRG